MNVVAFAPVRTSPRPPFPPDGTRSDSLSSITAIGRGAPGPVDDIGSTDDRAVAVALARVVASETFRHSKRHQAFLSYLVHAVVDRRGASLKEVVIGLEVFGRSLDGYDPLRDSIVRVEARRLRGKLARYYAGEGRRDPLEIRLPVGRYVPVFALRGIAEVTSTCKPLIAVLPLLTDTLQGASATGIADSVMHRLGAMTGLRILAPMTAAALRDDPQDVRTHGVDYVLEGTLVVHGARARCVVHLSRTRDRMRAWSGHFDFVGDDGGAIDWLAAQDRVADEVAGVVAKTLETDGAAM